MIWLPCSQMWSNACKFPVWKLKKCESVVITQYFNHLTRIDRCFLFLVNYARIKSDVAIKALPVLIKVMEYEPVCFEHTEIACRIWKTPIR